MLKVLLTHLLWNSRLLSWIYYLNESTAEVSERCVVVGGGGLMMAGSDFPLAAPIHTLITVGNVEEKVLFVMLLVERSHGG